MTDELEAAGALVTATLAAKAIDQGGQTAPDGRPSHDAHCANCGTALQGAYCHQCGQVGHVHRSLLHLVEEFLHGVWHFETKGWRTIPLLAWKPGVLTRRFIDGQRVRYVSPLALFLFMVFFMFFVFSVTTSSERSTDAKNGVVKIDGVMPAEEEKKTEQEINQVKTELQKQLGDAEDSEAASSAKGVPEKGITLTGVKHRHPKLHAMISHAIKNPELTLYKAKNAAYKFAFILVPFSLPFLWLMFCRRKDITMFDHAVFALYSLSFMALLFSAVAVLGRLSFDGWAALLVLLIPPIHIYRQIRDTYNVHGWSCVWRTGVLTLNAAFLLLCYLLFVLAMGMS